MTTRSIRSILRVCALVLLFAVIPAALIAQRTSKEYRGLMGGKMSISMHLETAAEQLDQDGQMVDVIQYTGYYSYDSKGTPIVLYGSSTTYPGEPTSPFSYLMLQEEVNGELTGTFNGQFSSEGSFIGYWGNPEYTKIYPFILYPTASGSDAAQRELDKLAAFWSDFQRALKKDDKEKVAGMIRFPFPGSGYVIGEWERGLDKKEFLKHYKKIFTKKARQIAAKTVPADLYPMVAASDNTWGIPGGTPIYYMRVNYDDSDGESTISFGFGKLNGAYKLLVLELAG